MLIWKLKCGFILCTFERPLSSVALLSWSLGSDAGPRIFVFVYVYIFVLDHWCLVPIVWK